MEDTSAKSDWSELGEEEDPLEDFGISTGCYIVESIKMT